MKKLILGATGSIGSAVSRNIQKSGGKTHLVGRNEKEISSRRYVALWPLKRWELHKVKTKT